ncbi:hypothetical protein [Ignatzschineria sp. LJL83]
MKKTALLALLVINTLLTVTKGEIDEGKNINYIVNFRYHNMYCNFYVNKIPLHSSAGRSLARQWTFMDRIGMFLKEGNNTFEVEGVDLPEDRDGAFCEMVISSRIANTETQKHEIEEVSSLRLTYDENREFTIVESKEYETTTVTDQPILEQLSILSYEKEIGLQNNVMASRSLKVNHPFKTHSWKYKATPFEDTLENREKLWRKYEEMHQIMEAKNYKNFVQALQPGLKETEVYQGDPKTRSWENSLLASNRAFFNSSNLTMRPIDRDYGYELLISDDGLLFRFGGDGIGAPQRLYSSLFYSNGLSTNMTFTLIDGEIVIAF